MTIDELIENDDGHSDLEPESAGPPPDQSPVEPRAIAQDLANQGLAAASSLLRSKVGTSALAQGAVSRATQAAARATNTALAKPNSPSTLPNSTAPAPRLAATVGPSSFLPSEGRWRPDVDELMKVVLPVPPAPKAGPGGDPLGPLLDQAAERHLREELERWRRGH